MNEKLKKLIEARQSAINESKEICNRIDEGGLTDEKRAELEKRFDELTKKTAELKSQIERTKQVIADEADNERAAGETREEDKGIDPSGGHGLIVTTSSEERAKVQVVAEPATKWDSIGQFLRAVMLDTRGGDSRRHPEVQRLHKIIQEQRDLQVQIPSDGGYLVQQDFSRQIFEQMFTGMDFMPETLQITLGPNSNSVEIPAIDQTSRADGSQYGGITVYWEDEGATITAASDPKVSTVNLKANKLFAVTVMTSELIEDASALASYTMQVVPKAMRSKAANSFFRGTGAGQPLGILNAPCLIEVAAEANQNSTELKWENLLKMVSHCANINTSRWYISRQVVPALYNIGIIVGGGGTVATVSSDGGGNKPLPSQIVGRPIEVVEYCSALGTVGDIVLGDFSQYVTIRKSDIVSASSIHVYFLSDKQAFRWTWRLDGQPLWRTAVTEMNSSNTISPFIALATRS